MKLRPDDIDMNQHVHGSRYMDYVLAARYEQMDSFKRYAYISRTSLGEHTGEILVNEAFKFVSDSPRPEASVKQ